MMYSIAKTYGNRILIMMAVAGIGAVISEICSDSLFLWSFGIQNDIYTIAAAIIEIIKWNLCVVPPILLCYSMFNMECSKLYLYTVLRYSSVKRWWKQRSMFILLLCSCYSLLLMLIHMITTVGETIEYREYLIGAVLFTLHIAMLGYCMVLCMTSNYGASSTILTYLAIEIGMVILGIRNTYLKVFLPPYWGMMRYICAGENKYLKVCIATMLSIVTCFMINVRIQKQCNGDI